MKSSALILTWFLLSTAITRAEGPPGQEQPVEPLVLRTVLKGKPFAHATLNREQVLAAGGKIPRRGEKVDEGVGLTVAVERGTAAFAKLMPNWQEDWVLHSATRQTFASIGRVYRVQFVERVDEGSGPAEEFRGISVYVLFDGTVVPIEKDKP
jgi:hypothetical protein